MMVLVSAVAALLLAPLLLHQAAASLLDDPDAARLLLGEAQHVSGWVRAQRRALHAIPELMYQEEKTSLHVRHELKLMDIPFTWPVAGTGIVARIGSGKAPVVALRADMDALPILEPGDLEAGRQGWASTHPGRMHACGHDAHMAMLLGAARVLKAHEPLLHELGTVLLLFQPAEEGGGGAKRMAQEGALRLRAAEEGGGEEGGVQAQAVVGLHVWPGLPTGTIASKAGIIMAASDRFTLRLQGRGAHGAMPHMGADPVVAGSALVLALQTLVSRETSPLDAAVVTVGVFSTAGGRGASNIIADFIELQGTLRALSEAAMSRLRRRVTELANATATAHGCSLASIEFNEVPYVPVVNDDKVVQLVSALATRLAAAAAGGVHATNSTEASSPPSPSSCSDGGEAGGTCAWSDAGGATGEDGGGGGNATAPAPLKLPDSVSWHELPEPSMAAEDFAFLAQEVPGAFVFLGSGSSALGTDVSLHNPRFQLDESVLALGVALHVGTALELLRSFHAA